MMQVVTHIKQFDNQLTYKRAIRVVLSHPNVVLTNTPTNGLNITPPAITAILLKLNAVPCTLGGTISFTIPKLTIIPVEATPKRTGIHPWQLDSNEANKQSLMWIKRLKADDIIIGKRRFPTWSDHQPIIGVATAILNQRSKSYWPPSQS